MKGGAITAEEFERMVAAVPSVVGEEVGERHPVQRDDLRAAQLTPGSRTTLLTRPLPPSDREYTPARFADKHLPEANCLRASILSPAAKSREGEPDGGHGGAEPVGGGAFLLRDRLLGFTLSASR